LNPFDEVTPDALNQLLKQPLNLDSTVASSLNKLKEDFFDRKDRQPNMDELRQMHVSCYALSKTG